MVTGVCWLRNSKLDAVARRQLARFVLSHQEGALMSGRPQVDGAGNWPTVEFEQRAGVVARPRGLRAGMALGEVVALLGPADIVTRGPAGREIWMWDGVSSARLDPDAAGPGLLAGAGILRKNGRADEALTVVVRFDELHQVSSVSLLASRG